MGASSCLSNARVSLRIPLMLSSGIRDDVPILNLPLPLPAISKTAFSVETPGRNLTGYFENSPVILSILTVCLSPATLPQLRLTSMGAAEASPARMT